MNCFEWQTRVSDYLDGILMGNAKREAEEHLDQCETCSEKHKHYRILLTSIASQPRASLPVPIRKAPLLFSVPRKLSFKAGKTAWRQIPWYLRTTLEGASIVFVVLFAISMGPKVRALYDRQIEKSLNEFTETFNDSTTLAESTVNVPLLRKGTTEAAGPLATSGLDDFQDDNGEESGDAEDSSEGEEIDNSADDIRVGNSEIWRFNLKTDSPHEIRPRIVQILTELNLPKTTVGLGGIEAPGGIQFDLIVPPSVVPNLKRQLQKLAPKAPAELSDTPMGETFAWYKNKSRRKIPDGKTRVVIWLSQM